MQQVTCINITAPAVGTLIPKTGEDSATFIFGSLHVTILSYSPFPSTSKNPSLQQKLQKGTGASSSAHAIAHQLNQAPAAAWGAAGGVTLEARQG